MTEPSSATFNATGAATPTSETSANVTSPAAATSSAFTTAAQTQGLEGGPSDADAMSDELSQAQGELLVLKAQHADLKDQLLRAHADVQNARRRAEEEIAKARKFGIESFAESLLPVLDSLEAGLSIQSASAQQLREGAEATLRQLKSALSRNKVVEVNPAVAETFDPTCHQAISAVPSEQAANTVVAVLQKGYLIAERVLRPALVTVAASK